MRDLQCLKAFELMYLMQETARVLHMQLVDKKTAKDISISIHLIQEYEHALNLLSQKETA